MTSATEKATASTAKRRPTAGEAITRGSIATVLIALGVLWLAHDGGAYGVVARGTAAIAVVWTVAAGVVFGLWPARRLGVATWTVGALLAGFAGFTLLSASWAPSAERAVGAFELALLYAAVFLLVALAATVVDRTRIGDGLAWGIVLVGALALASRLFPHLVPTRDGSSLLPSVHGRLNYPLGYWNALGILLALAVPLLLRIAVEAGPLAASFAVAALPGLSAPFYLTASRGAVVAGLVGVLGFVLLTERRVAAVVALAVGGVGSAAAVAVLRAYRPLVDAPVVGGFGSDGKQFAVLLLLITAATGFAFLTVRTRLAARLVVSRKVERTVAVGLVVVTLAVALAAHPVRRIHAFTAPLPSGGGQNFIQSHLASSSGNGRWQFWSAAVDEFRAHPLAGGGAGSYEPWWAQHGSLDDFVRNAHSLYLETLGELGLVGLTLLGGAFLVGLWVGARRLRASEERTTQAAFLAAFGAFAVAAAADWIWQLAAVGAVGIACLALVLAGGNEEAPRLAWLPRLAVAAIALLLVAVEAVPLLGQLRLERSQAAVRRGDTTAALRGALDARDLEPWASSPALQLALVTEQEGQLGAAHDWIEEALRRDATDWRLWLVASRIEAKQREVQAAAASLSRAIELDPHSSLFGS